MCLSRTQAPTSIVARYVTLALQHGESDTSICGYGWIRYGRSNMQRYAATFGRQRCRATYHLRHVWMNACGGKLLGCIHPAPSQPHRRRRRRTRWLSAVSTRVGSTTGPKRRFGVGEAAVVLASAEDLLTTSESRPQGAPPTQPEFVAPAFHLPKVRQVTTALWSMQSSHVLESCGWQHTSR